MRFIRRGPLGYRPECIHQPPRAVREFVGEPPLGGEGCMGGGGESLEIRYPVVSPISSFAVGFVSSLGKINRLSRCQPRTMAIAALARGIAAIAFATPLLRCNSSAVHDVFWPFRRGLYPFDQ